MKTESMKRPLVTMGIVVVAVLAACAVDVKDDFESSLSAGWSGNCAVSNNVGSYAQTPPGAPIYDVNHTKMLSIAGTAARSYSDDGDVSGNRVVDLLVMAEEMPDEELPEGGDDDQVKFAFDTNGCINLYHKRPGGDAAQWSKLADTVYANGQWVRVSFGFDYTSKRCQLKVDGSPLVSDYGYRSASGSETPGSWYSLANQSATALAAIDFVGCGGVDDVVNAVASTYTPSTGATTATNGVDFAWFDKNGIAWCDPTATNVASGYTVKEAFDTGVDPYSTNKLYMAAAEYTSSKLRLTVNGYGKTYAVETKATPFTDGVAGTDANAVVVAQDEAANTTTLECDFPVADGVTYYRVRNSNPSLATAETVNQFAIMKVTSTATNTLVALPWRSLSANISNPAAITAANVVMTNNLTIGDWLLYYDGGYKGWHLTSEGWVGAASASVDGITVAAPAQNAELERGQAIWVVRADPSKPFYLYGQYQEASGTTTVVSGGCLMASPKTDGTSFTVSAANISDAANGDRIVVPSTTGGLPKVFECRGGVWGTIVETSVSGPNGKTMTQRTWTTTGEVMNIPAGSGFMYQGSGTPTITW